MSPCSTLPTLNAQVFPLFTQIPFLNSEIGSLE
ncbi:hypothetical protein Krac_0591 [Ktedonobacter racemifer DSM 44963]|uniref:Uncharacterized protein n=1 Tax=Ktedonobacter racemifer DSM 44963 TaxID=485913 RepID=D6U841_KTERA|nr:hypothetical protein Krac_0591 [Ktedonobacter racemifer DSM 44963]